MDSVCLFVIHIVKDAQKKALFCLCTSRRLVEDWQYFFHSFLTSFKAPDVTSLGEYPTTS